MYKIASFQNRKNIITNKHHWTYEATNHSKRKLLSSFVFRLSSKKLSLAA